MTDNITEPQRETVASSCSQRGVSRSRCRGQFPHNIVVRKLIAGRSGLGPFLAHRNMNGRVLHTAACGMPVKHKVRHAWKQPVHGPAPLGGGQCGGIFQREKRREDIWIGAVQQAKVGLDIPK